MTSKLNFGRDIQGFNAYAPGFSQDRYSANLASASASTVTVPSNFTNWIAALSYQSGSTIWVTVNDNATPPGGATFSQTNSELLPASKTVKAGDIISFYNNGASAADIGVALYAVS